MQIEKRKRGRPRKSTTDDLACRFDDLSVKAQADVLAQFRTIHMLAQRRSAVRPPVRISEEMSAADIEQTAGLFETAGLGSAGDPN